MGHRRSYGLTLLLGASLLLAAGRSHGQVGPMTPPVSRPVVATAVPAPLIPPPAPFAPNNQATAQQTSFMPPGPPPAPPAAPPSGAPTRPVGGNGLVREAASATPPPAVVPASGLMSGLPAAPPPPANPAAPPNDTPRTTAAVISVEVVGPEQVTIGQPLTHEIIVRNVGNRTAAEVRVEEPLPAGARLLRTDPPAQTPGDRPGWNLGTLEPGAERRVKIEVQPAGAGELQCKPTVTYQAGGLRTQVSQPQFDIEVKADHDKTTRGGRIAFSIRLANHGQTLIRGIKLYDYLPAGLHHPALREGGERIVGITRFGDLQPGETRTIQLETTAIQAGQFKNEVVAQADGGVEARGRVAVTVTEPSLALRLEGPKKGTTQRELDYQIEVANPGPAAATKVRLVQALPPSFEVIAASTGAALDASQHTLTWMLSDLAPEQRQVVTFRIKAKAAGDWPMYTALLADNIPETRVANVVRLEGAAVVSLEIHAREDRLAVGEETVCEMHVFNQGDAACAGVRLTATLPEQLIPLDAQGPNAGQVQQQRVQFPALAQLPPRGDAVYRIRVRGQRAGKGNVRAELTTERDAPVQSDLSIQVNAATVTTSPPGGSAPAAPIEKAPVNPVAAAPQLH